MKIHLSIIGIGYVGLSTAVGFASKGFTVVGSDLDKERIKQIQEGNLPFYEPSLLELLRDVLRAGKLNFTSCCEDAVLKTDVTFVTVGTPSRLGGRIDLRCLKEAVCNIGDALSKKKTYHLVVIKSTVTPTTTGKLLNPILEKHSGKNCGDGFGLCMNPEFLREGSALEDILKPNRIIIGEYDEKSGKTLEALYRKFYSGNIPPVIRTSLPNAELIKYASNSFLAAKISFINTIANICEKTPGTDVKMVAKGMGLDKRIDYHFLNAGLGYGGSCFSKDLKALIAYSETKGYKAELLGAVENVNKTQPWKAVDFCKKLLKNLESKNIAILGLAFKPNTDDMRDAVSVPIINKLLEEKARITAYDPLPFPMPN